ncbi:hypothetical protein Q5P01_021144 [Channa striata]|uniref:Uncharacterized protein n=1 Tax=Channa striata TaxID=64152 RepID=A0AA88LTS2_CHASR|nr:hypothetical protein Q5P01_021144 [Channa striata]
MYVVRGQRCQLSDRILEDVDREREDRVRQGDRGGERTGKARISLNSMPWLTGERFSES